MEFIPGPLPNRVSRLLGLALACLATSFLFTTVTVVFTAGAGAPADEHRVAQSSLATPAPLA